MRKIVEAGQTETVLLFNKNNAGVMVHPGIGATALVEFTFSSADDIAADTAMWDDWAAGAVTTKRSDVFDAQVSAVRLSSIGNTSTFEIRG